MPEKDGIEMLMVLKREFPEVRLIAISGGGRLGPEEYLPIAKKLGALHTFKKPFDRKEILNAVRDILGNQSSGKCIPSGKPVSHHIVEQERNVPCSITLKNELKN